MLVAPLVLAGCGAERASVSTQVTDPAEAASTSPSAETADSSRIAAYETLAADVNGFFVAATEAERQHPGATPGTAEEVLVLVDYDLAPAVELERYSDTDARICFTGPGGTYLTLSAAKVDLQRTLGTGTECDYQDGDVVTEIRLLDDTLADPANGLLFEERVVKGKSVARQVPSLASFIDIINDGTQG